MAYILKESDNNKIVFVPEGSGCGTAMFVVLGSFFFLIGVGLNLWGPDWEFPFSMFKILFPLFGLGAVAVGITNPKRERSTNPQIITFDNSKGAVVIEMTPEGTQTGYIRYDEIEKFDLYIESRTSSSSTSSTINRTHYYYHVFLKKKDGGEWYLTESDTKDKAQAILSEMNKKVLINKATTIQIKPVFTDKLIKEEKIEKTVISWQNKVTFWAPLFLLVFGAVFLSILFGAATSDLFKGFGFIGYFIVGFMLVIFFMVMFISAKSMVKDATTRYAVAIGKVNLEYFEYAKSTEAIKKTKAIPLQEVHSVSYTFSHIKNYSIAGLEIRTHKQHEQIQKDKDKPFEMLKDVFTGNNQPVRLKINALNPVECLQLETWLQELIKKKGNEKVL